MNDYKIRFEALLIENAKLCRENDDLKMYLEELLKLIKE